MARTLTMLRGGRRGPSSRHLSPSGSPIGTPSSGSQGYPKSILIPANQRALASRGFYLQHGWPDGMFAEEQPVPQDPDDMSSDAASRRKMFKKTRSRRNWSLCGSGEEEGKPSVNTSGEWVTKSMDDSLNRDDSAGADDTLGRLAYFSTTTESSTDSLDGKNMETEKALEEIRRQFNEGHARGRERRSSSEDLFVPNRHAHERLNDGSLRENSIQKEDEDDKYSVEGEFLAARSNNYFVSPAASRQATVEKAPSDCDQSSGIFVLNDPESLNDGNNNRNCIEEEKITKESSAISHSTKRVAFPDFSKLKNSSGGSSSAPVSFDQSDGKDDGDDDDDSSTIINNRNNNDSNSNKVRIIVSGSFDSATGGNEFCWLNRQPSPSDVRAAGSSSSPSPSPHLAVSKEGVQRASSDSGSSSSGTAVGSSSMVADLDTLRTSESESSVTERDSISRTNSPSGFLLAAAGGAHSKGTSGESKRETASKACQTSDSDLAEIVSRSPAADDEKFGGRIGSVHDNANNVDNNGNSSNGNASSVIKVKVVKKGAVGTEFVLEGRRTSSPGGDQEDQNHHRESSLTMEERRALRESQLSPLPPGINPLELMKRLRRSQEELPRMESIQSDSSGFGEADLGLDTAPVEVDNVKTPQVSSLGSSGESNGTLASSGATTVIAHQLCTGDAATQTGSSTLDLVTMGKTSQEDESFQNGTGPKDSTEIQRYITTCIIPSVAGEASSSSSAHRPYPQHHPHHHHHPKDAPIARGFSKDDNFVVTPRDRSHSDRRQTSPSILSYVSEIKYNVNDGYLTNRKTLDDKSDYDDGSYQPFLQQFREHGRRRYVSQGGTPLLRPTSLAFGQRDHSYASPAFVYSEQQRSKPRRYHSECELRVGSTDNMDTVSTARNDIPLSEELANARDRPWTGNFGSTANMATNFSSSSTPPSTAATTSVNSLPPNTSTPTASVTTDDPKKQQGHSRVSSITMYINAKDGNNESPSTPSSYSLSHHRFNNKNPEMVGGELSYHQPIAGNLSGMTNSSRRTTSSVGNGSDHFNDRGNWRHRSLDILEDDGVLDFESEESAYPAGFSADASPTLTYGHRRKGFQGKRYSSPAMTGTPRADLRPYMTEGTRHSIPASAASRTMDDLEAYASSAGGESGSEFSVQSFPDDASSKSGVMDAQKLARLINKPVYYRGRQGPSAHYRPRRNFREWHGMSRRKRVQEENRLLQHSIQKYKEELNTMQTSFVYDTQLVYDDLTDEEREEIDELEWLWEEVRGQVSETERLLVSRMRSVHAGNDFHSLLSSLGVINRTIDLLKEQIYQQQVSSHRSERPEEDPAFQQTPPPGEDNPWYHPHSNLPSPQERLTFLPSRTYLEDMASGHHHRSPYHPHPHGPHRSSFSRHTHSASMSSLPTALNVSLDQIKSSLLKEMKDEIRASTQKLEEDLLEKDKEIQALRQQLEQDKKVDKDSRPSLKLQGSEPHLVEREQAASSSLQTAAAPPPPPSSSSSSSKKAQSLEKRRSWEPKKDPRGHRRSRSRIFGDRLVTETDV